MSPDLLDRSLRKYNKAVEGNPKLTKVYSKIANKTATYVDAKEFASLAGLNLADVTIEALVEAGAITEEDALKLIPGLLKGNHDRVTRVTEGVQKIVNEKAGVGLQPANVRFDTDRANSLARHLAGLGDVSEREGSIRLDVENNSLSIVDTSIKLNAMIQLAVGLEPTIYREYDGVGLHGGKDACQWCLERAGTWTYQEAVDNGVFQRHPGCGCTITYTTEKGTDVQTDWTTNTWTRITR